MRARTEFISQISAPTISTSFDFRDLVKGRLMCKVYVQTQFRSLCAFLSRSLVTPRHPCVIMHEVVHESLRKICHYQQNVPQHYYLLDTLVLFQARKLDQPPDAKIYESLDQITVMFETMSYFSDLQLFLTAKHDRPKWMKPSRLWLSLGANKPCFVVNLYVN